MLQARRIAAAKAAGGGTTEEFVAIATEPTVDTTTEAAPVEVTAEVSSVAVEEDPKPSKSTRRKTTKRKTTAKKRTTRTKTTRSAQAATN